ncbi:MAG: hypothetical protein M3Y34_01160 [Actinomycetota bacterium]|nr:hypothetical protein [Actinomycetota bacterium]
MRGQGAPGLIIGLVVLVIAIGVGVWLTSSGDNSGPPAEDTEAEKADEAAKVAEERSEERRELREERLEERQERREERLDALEESGGSNGSG